MRDNNEMNDPKTVNLETRVFPLLNLRLGQDGRANTVEYLGTCFLLNLVGQHVFVTASHLLGSTPDKCNLHISYCQSDGRASYVKVRCALVKHVRKDVSFFLPTLEMTQEYDGLISSMGILREELGVDQGVLVYGFPESQQREVIDGTPLVHIRRRRLEGKVVEIENDYALTSIGRVYRLNVAAPRGLSGAPVMVILKERILVAGYVIGEQSSNGEPTAICSDASPLLEIEKLLLDMARSTESSQNDRSESGPEQKGNGS